MSDKKKINPEEMKRSWHSQQEDILKDWSEQAGCYRWMHERAYQNYNKKNMRYAIPVIIISTVTGTANFAQGSFPEGAKTWAPLLIGTLNLAAGLITTISQFLRVSELLEGHRAASIAYSKLSRNIAVELSLPADERTMSGIEYIKQCRGDIDRLIEQSPAVPPEILKAFSSSILNVSKKNPMGITPAFSVPAILKLEPIDVFRTEKDEEERMVKLLKAQDDEKKYKEQILKEEQDKISKAIEDHEKKRNSIIGEYDLENKLKILEQQTQYEKNMEEKKKNMTLKSLTKKMTKFNKILIDDSSSDDNEDPLEENVKITIHDQTIPEREPQPQPQLQLQPQPTDNIITETVDNIITDISNNSN